MSALELKKELHQIIDNSDSDLAQVLYNLITTYLSKSENTKMIMESEDDIQSGRIHSQDDVKKMIESWKES
jgi:hypothetical protein